MSDFSRQPISLIVPCCDEEANLKRFPEEVFDALSEILTEMEVVFIDDGSTDQTYGTMLELQKKYPRVKVIRNSGNLGLGSSLREGFKSATHSNLVTFDADLTFPPHEIPLLLKGAAPGVDCVMGSPFKGTMDQVNVVRKFLSWSVNKIYAILIGKNISSVSSIFRLYRKEKIDSLDLSCTSFDINAEILFKILHAGGHVVEVPVTLGRRSYGVSKINVPREIINHLKMFVKIVGWKIGR
ncbi:MAG: Polyprenol monophosphomannose synthase [Elusimicrobia bacterium]|nr:Polyprenol monophosphomannose synthase [Elusimicrobiota bacterium]